MSDSAMTGKEHPVGKMPSEGTGNQVCGSHVRPQEAKGDLGVGGREGARQEPGAGGR